MALPYIPGGPRLSKVNEKVRCNVERPSVLRALINDYNLYRRRAESKNQRSFLLRANVNVSHGLLYKWTELLYLTCRNEVDLLTLIMSQKLTQYL